jgi:starch synthase
MAQKYPDRFAFQTGFRDKLAHLIFAGSDMLLMPSQFEPCGLNQLYGLRYGTVPVVRATGGLRDTVADYNARTRSGTGFTFDQYEAGDMLNALKQALAAYSNATQWIELGKRGMAQDWSWEKSAQKYLALYRKIYQQRNSED